MKQIELRLVALEKRTVYCGTAEIVQRLTAAQAAEVVRYLEAAGDDVLEDVIRFSLGLPPGTVLTDAMLEAIASGSPDNI